MERTIQVDDIITDDGAATTALDRAFGHLGRVLLTPNALGICEPRWLNMHREVRETLGTHLMVRSAPQRAAESWLELGLEQEARRAYGAARRSMARARALGGLLSSEQRCHANLHLGLLVLGLGATPSVARRKHAERLLREAVAAEPTCALALWHLGLLLVSDGPQTKPRGVEMLRAALEATQRSGRSLRSMAMHLPGGAAEGVYEAELRADAAIFASFCASSAALHGATPAATPQWVRTPPPPPPATVSQHAPPAALVRCLEELKALVADADWLLDWATESAETFGPRAHGSAYGEMPFASWRAVVTRPAVVAALAAQPQAGQPQVAPHASEGSTAGEGAAAGDGAMAGDAPHALVLGSALGYMCLFFSATGVPSIGIELLAESMVGASRRVLSRHGLLPPGGAAAIELRSGDARYEPLRDARRGAPRLIWMNDEAWPSHVRNVVLRRAAKALSPGGVLVSWHVGRGASLPRGLRLIERLYVSPSWQTVQEVQLFGKRS